METFIWIAFILSFSSLSYALGTAVEGRASKRESEARRIRQATIDEARIVVLKANSGLEASRLLNVLRNQQ